MIHRVTSALLIAGYLAAALLPCPAPGSGSVSAARVAALREAASDRTAAAMDHATPGHDHHAHHAPAAEAVARTVATPSAHAAHQASEGDAHAHHHPAPASRAEPEMAEQDADRAAKKLAFTPPCPCGCDGKVGPEAGGGKLGPRLLASAQDWAANPMFAAIEPVSFDRITRSLEPPEAIPLLEFVRHS